MKRYALLMIMAAVVVMVGCSQQASQPASQAAANYFPLGNGYSWSYREAFTTTGEVELSSASQARTVEGTTVLSNGLTASNMVTSGPWSGTNTAYYYVDGSGVYQYGTAAQPTTEASKILAYPLAAGKVWTRNINGPLSCEAAGLEDVTVPAGTFRAMRVNVAGDTNFSEWYAEGVGLVKIKLSVIMVTTEAGTGLVTYKDGYYIVQLVSKNF